MKNRITLLIAMIAIAVAAAGCSFSTANMSGLKTFKDKEGKSESTSFKAGETVYANAEISNSMDKVTVKFHLSDEKGAALPGTDIKVDLPSSGTAKYTLPLPAGIKGGKYTITAEMLNEKGEKKDSKTATINVEAGAAPAAPAAPADSKSDDHATDKDEDK